MFGVSGIGKVERRVFSFLIVLAQSRVNISENCYENKWVNYSVYNHKHLDSYLLIGTRVWNGLD